MDIHVKIAAALHIVSAVLGLLLAAFLLLLLVGFSSLLKLSPSEFALLNTFGGIAIAVVAVFATAQLLAGVFCLRGASGAKIWLIVFSIFSLFNFPIGTVFGVYSLWALLRPVPAPVEKTINPIV
ncbi:hypothetical protein [Chitinimonas sp.]|uniref:hypothetical protein n=1 Tax=Chitinimonas sp. TaxID=1934313 RepID=UPI0035B38CC9